MSATEQPKRPQSAYWIWLGEHRESLQKELPGKKGSEVSKLAGERWQALSADQKQPYVCKAAEAKAAYEEAMQSFKAQGGIVVKRGSKGDKDGRSRKQRDEDAPKRPVGGAFGCFLAEKREEVKAQLPAGHKITDVTKKMGELWKAVSDEEKGKYEKAFEKKQEEYKAAMEEHKRKSSEVAVRDEAEKGAGTMPNKRAAVPSSDSPSQKRGRGRGKDGGSVPQASAAEQTELDASVLTEACKLGEVYERNLRSLAARPEVKASGKSAQQMLVALKGAQGLLHPARRALLGA